MNAYLKDIFREIKNTLGRFFSLLIITALGAASVVGIQATAIDMRDIADKFYKEHNLYDLQLKSTMGFDDEDIAALKNTKGVLSVMPTYIYDVFLNIENEVLAARTYALPEGLNTIDVLEGRLPDNATECVIESRLLKAGGYELGDSITLALDDMEDYFDAFYEDTFTIVGVVSSPLYLTNGRGNTSLGNGSLSYYLYLHKDAYKFLVYTDVYVLMNDSQNIYNLAEDYDNFADEWKEEIKQTGNERVLTRENELLDAQREIDEGFEEYYNSLREIEEEFDEQYQILEEYSAEDGVFNNQDGILNSQEEALSAETEARNAEVEALKMQALKEELDTLKAEALSKLEEAKNELLSAQEELKEAGAPEWFYFTRKDGVAFDSYYQDTFRLQKLGYVFPMVFFLVAIMVSLTTMSRMVEEQRTQIGIYKALGYRPVAITMKYLIYAFSASMIGGFLGVLLGSYFFPLFISDAYGYLYKMPPVETPIPVFLSILAITIAVLSVVLVTLFTCVNAMRGVPAILMRPKSPTIGKHVLLEKIPFLWNRFSFIGKVTARNIFRYKKRFIMSLVGVAGCSALLLTAFGLRDSIGSVSLLQFDTIISYDTRMYLKEITTNKQRESLDAILPENHLYIREESMDVTGKNDKMSASLFIPEFYDELNEYINLYSPNTGDLLPLTSDGVLVTEKLARVTGIVVGDSFLVTAGDGRTYTMVATGIVENYVSHYIYMSPNVYASVFGEEVKPNSVLAFTEEEQKLAREMLDNDNVRAVVHTADLLVQLRDSTDALGIVTIVLIVLACALAFVVLFNLTNINISERIRELATIKVLGFYDMELAMYVYRENGAVTAMGILLGLFGGILLDRFVLASVEIDLLKFSYTIYVESYVYAIVLSVVFAVFVNLVMNFKLKRIDMVESLKNVE